MQNKFRVKTNISNFLFTLDSKILYLKLFLSLSGNIKYIFDLRPEQINNYKIRIQT